MLGKIENIAHLGVKPISGECSYRVFRMANGHYKECQYQIGTLFEIKEQYESGKMIVVDPDGDLIAVPAEEAQCFRDVFDCPK